MVNTKRLALAVIVIIAAVVGLKVLALNFFPRASIITSSFPQPDESGWQAIFLTNDQVYFGKLSNYNKEYVTLDKVFYLRAADPLQQGTAGPALNLVKLGGELHGPTDMMYIPKDKVMFWENMGPNAQIVQAINSFLGGQQ